MGFAMNYILSLCTLPLILTDCQPIQPTDSPDVSPVGQMSAADPIGKIIFESPDKK